MVHSNLTRWIEDAEARQVFETAMVGRGWAVTETHYLHLGGALATTPLHGVSHDWMSIGCHVLDRVRHPRARRPD
ncbi:MAG TPA: hypothetical protein VFC56_19105 [Stellaceae bacterium]|nr:hypothetical protein [Stellaceae bacterium]